MYLQIIDKKPKHAPTAADYKRLGQMLTELGKQTADLGIPLGYHNHMGAMGQTPEEVDRVMECVRCAVCEAGVGYRTLLRGRRDPAKAILKYSDRLLFLHLKDVKPLAAEAGAKHDYQFAELGQGKVDLDGSVRGRWIASSFAGGRLLSWMDRRMAHTRRRQSAEVSKQFLQKAGLAL